MREIKFRGIDVKTDEWVYGSLITWPDGEVMIFDTLMSDGSMGGRIINPDTLGQFTGLRDKSGKEIYEGDILDVNYADEESRLEVRFVRGVFAFLWGGNLDDEFPCNAPTHEWAEVVGNIHDNPELIKS